MTEPITAPTSQPEVAAQPAPTATGVRRPWLVVATQVELIPLATVWGALQVEPPLVEEMKPTLSWVLPEG